VIGLVIAPCSYAAARYAVMNWHYSACMPVAKPVRFGAWEDGEFIGAVVFGRGANPRLFNPYDLDMTEGAELTRIALAEHRVPVSQIVSRAVKHLKASNPGLRLLVSYADPVHGHHGGIYQAMNWTYTGMTAPAIFYRDNLGSLHHPRSMAATGFTRRSPGLLIADAVPVRRPGKHRYLLPLDRAMARQISPLARPYPTRSTLARSEEES
jgi:hypothetical protein